LIALSQYEWRRWHGQRDPCRFIYDENAVFVRIVTMPIRPRVLRLYRNYERSILRRAELRPSKLLPGVRLRLADRPYIRAAGILQPDRNIELLSRHQKVRIVGSSHLCGKRKSQREVGRFLELLLFLAEAVE